MLIHVTGVPDFVGALSAAMTATALRTTPHVGRAGLVVRSHNGSQGPWVTPHDLDDLPRLDVTFGESRGRQRVRIGPLSVPGVTACPGCVAAHERESGALAPLRPLGSVAFPSPALVWCAAGFATRELVTAVEFLAHPGDDRPLVWSAVLEMDSTGLPVQTPVPRHVHCGCTWADFMLT